MNTLDKVYNLTIDIKNIDVKYNSYAKFFDDDRETSVIRIKLLNDKTPMNLENCIAEAYFILADNTYHNEACKIINSSEGVVELQLCQKCLVEGENIVRLSILKDNEISNTPVITYEVRKGLYSDNPSFNDDPLTPILSQMLLDIKVTKVNQIELQERYEKSLPKIEGKIKEVDNKISEIDKSKSDMTIAVSNKIEEVENRFNRLTSSQQQDAEVIDARVGENGKSYASLGDRLNEVDSQLEHTEMKIKYAKKQSKCMAKYKNKIINKQPIKIVCNGTSMTYGQDISSDDKRPSGSDKTLDNTINRPAVVEQASITYPEYLQQFLDEIYGDSLITVVNRGISGLRTNTALNFYVDNPSADLQIIELGTNDVDGSIETFIEEYTLLIERILDWDSALILITPPKHALDGNKKIEAIRQVIVNLGKMYTIPVIDSNEFLRGYPTFNVHAKGDGIHYNGFGYSVFASKIGACLIGLTDLLNPFKVNQNTQLAISNSQYGFVTNGSIKSIYNANNGVGELYDYGMGVSLSENQKFSLSFYATDEDLILVPIVNFKNNDNNLIIKLNNGIKQAYLTNRIKEGVEKYTNYTPTSELIITSTIDTTAIKKLSVKDIDSKVFRLSSKGWHSITIENTKDDVEFIGFVVYSYNDFILSRNYVGISNINENVTITNKTKILKDIMFISLSINIKKALSPYDTLCLLGDSTTKVPTMIPVKIYNTTSEKVVFIQPNASGIYMQLGNNSIDEGNYFINIPIILN